MGEGNNTKRTAPTSSLHLARSERDHLTGDRRFANCVHGEGLIDKFHASERKVLTVEIKVCVCMFP